MRTHTARKLAAYTLVGASIMASVILFYVIQSTGDSGHPNEQLISDQPTDDEPAPTQAPGNANKILQNDIGMPGPSELNETIPGLDRFSDDASALNFSGAKTAFDALSAIEAAEFKGLGIAKDWKIKLDSFCMESASGQSEEGREWLQSRVIEFCDGYDSAIDISSLNSTELYDLYDATYEKSSERRLIEKLKETSLENQSSLITQQVKNARFSEDIDAIQSVINQYIVEAGFSPWNPLELDSFPPHYFKSQNIALVMFKCLRFGSCGQNTIWFIQQCKLIPACGPSWNFEEIIYNLSTPLEYKTALSIMGELNQA